MSLVVFPFKHEELDVVRRNVATAAAHERVDEVWAVGAAANHMTDSVAGAVSEVGGVTPVRVFPQERLGRFRPGKGDGMNTAIARAAERGFDRVHFYDADITNFDRTWIDGAEEAADRGFGVVRHRFPRASTDAMITWLVTRPGLALLFPETILPRLGQPLGGEILVTAEILEALASDAAVVARSDWGIDTLITYKTATMDRPIYEHNAPDGKRHALYGSLTDIYDMALECLDAVASLRGGPEPGAMFHADPPAPVPEDLKNVVGFDQRSTRQSISGPVTPTESEVLQFLQAPDRDLTGEDWRSIFPRLLAGFDLADEAWRSVAFRLWVRRVLNYTANEVPQGYDHAISYLEKTIVEFEEVGVSSVRDG